MNRVALVGVLILLLSPLSLGNGRGADLRELAQLGAQSPSQQLPLSDAAGRTGTEEPSAGEPSAGEPSAGEPSAGEPSAGEPSAGEPSAGEPSAGEPSAGEPSAGDSPEKAVAQPASLVEPELAEQVTNQSGSEASGGEQAVTGTELESSSDRLAPATDRDQASLSASSDTPIGDSTPAPTLEADSAAASAANAMNASQGAPSFTWLNRRTHILLGVVLVTLAIASIVARYLRQRPTDSINPALVRRFRQRLSAWWLMCAILVFGLLLQSYGTVLLFWLVSFWALREFITMAPTRRGDHRALFWALIVFTPLQYLLIGCERIGVQWPNGRPIDFYGLYSIFIPVYASLFIPARIAIAGDHKRFLERSAQITAGLLICVYALSYAPALINLQLKDSQGNLWLGSRAGLLFFLVLVSQLADILHWTWGHLVGRRVIAPEISASRTWEGFAGGTLSTGLIGGSLFWVTPFTFWEAMGMSMIIAVMGMFGGMTMSAIKRDRGVNDYGTLVLGHAGVLDRIDTLCFAAPVFYHLTRFFFT